MDDFEETQIVPYMEKQFKISRPKKQKMSNLSFKGEQSQRLEPWSERTFELTSFQATRQTKPRQQFYKRMKEDIQRKKYRSTHCSKQISQYPHIYKIDSNEIENKQQKLKWRLQLEYNRLRRKKATQILKQKHFHTFDISQRKQQIRQSRGTINISEIYQKMHQVNIKSSKSEHLRLSAKLNTVQSNHQNVIKFGKSAMKRIKQKAQSPKFPIKNQQINILSVRKIHRQQNSK